MDYLKLLKKYEEEIIGNEFVKENNHTTRFDFAYWLNQQAAQQSVQRTCATCGENYALTDFILGNGKHICGHCGASR